MAGHSALAARWSLSAAIVAASFAALAVPLGLQARPSGADLDLVARHLEEDRHRDALRATSRMVAAHPRSAEALALHGLALIRAGEPGLARRHLRRAVEADPLCFEAHLGLGRLAFGRNHLEEARDHLARAAAGGRLRKEAAAELSRAAMVAGRAGEAREAAGEALRLDAGEVDEEARIRLEYLAWLGSDPILRIPQGFEGTEVRLLEREGRSGRGIREVPVEIDGQGPFPFDIDSALGGNLTLSPALADRLGLERAGSFAAAGIGTERRTTRGSRVDRIRIGDLVIENVPVLILDSPTFRGEEKGLLGTGILRRFDCTLDVDAGTLEIRPPGRPPRRGPPDSARVVVRVPMFVLGGPLVRVGMGRGRSRPFLLDTAAGVTLLDDDYFRWAVRPGIDPDAVRQVRVRGAGGSEEALMIPSAEVDLGGRSFAGLRVVVVDLGRLNRVSRRAYDGILGIDLLWRYRVHLDFSVPELVLEERSGAGG